MEYGVLLVTLLEIVVRYPGSEMVHVMEADTAGHPLQQCRELEIRTASDCGRGVVPMLVIFPVRILELVLHEEEPESRGDGDVESGQVDQQDACTEKCHESSTQYQNRGVRGPNTSDLASP